MTADDNSTSGATAQVTSIVFDDQIRKPDIDDRTYRLLNLSNGLRALIVRDPATDRASAAMDVRVGYLADPDDIPGLAHFLEHLLFLGTEKYPVENDYAQFISDVGGGHTNAYTAAENTSYFFEVSADGDNLEGALDRFAQFFIAPLFNESCTVRELKAVDSEHKKNLLDDYWRLQQLDQDLLSPSHPYSKFCTGSWETLQTIPTAKGINVRDALIKFYHQHYSAHRMNLVVLGKEGLDTLQEWVLTKFGPIKNNGNPLPTTSAHPLGANELKKIIYVRPIKEMESLSMTFPFPDTQRLYLKSPNEYITHLIGHESQGSILSLLKAKGFATELTCWHDEAGVNFSFFKIVVSLSEKGVANWEEVVSIVFQYIRLLQKTDVMEWVFDECKTMNSLSFRYREKVPAEDFTAEAAEGMHTYQPADVLSGPFLMEEFDADLIRNLISLLRPDNFRLMIASSTTKTSEDWQTAPHYGTEFCVKPISQELLNRWSSAPVSPELALPHRNPFIPTKFDFAPNDDSQLPSAVATPRIIRDSPTTRAWFLQDTVYKVPRTSMWLFVRSPDGYSSPRAGALTRLLFELAADALTEVTYYATMGDLHYGLDTSPEGFVLSFGGFTDKLPVLVANVVSMLTGMRPESTRFEVVKEALVREYKNFDNENPDHHASYYMTWMLQERLWTNADKLQELLCITVEDVLSHAKLLFNPVHIEALVHGPITSEEALLLVETVENGFAGVADRVATKNGTIPPTKPSLRALPPSLRSTLLRTFQVPTTQSLADRSAKPPAATTLPLARSSPDQTPTSPPPATRASTLPQGLSYSSPHPNPDNPNSAVELFLQTGDTLTSTPLRARTQLFAQLVGEPFFDVLRTKEQLGYTVWSALRSGVGSLGVRFLVQGEKDAAYVEERIERFLDEARSLIEEMAEDDFATQVSALQAKLLETDKSQSEATHRMWDAITQGHYCFDMSQQDAACVGTLSKGDMIDFYDAHVSRRSPERRRLAVLIWSQKKPPSLWSGSAGGVEVEGQEEEKEVVGSVRLESAEAAVEERSRWLLGPGSVGKM
ncbi:Metalloenzyme, LuxS/M16 peptidase-like protein [Zopfochytrium polystomum]|nr:Metalloenzyme, LuxS/M16 peptidase-like protein [Zopfochytrium polystomum]